MLINGYPMHITQEFMLEPFNGRLILFARIFTKKKTLIRDKEDRRQFLDFCPSMSQGKRVAVARIIYLHIVIRSLKLQVGLKRSTRTVI